MRSWLAILITCLCATPLGVAQEASNAALVTAVQREGEWFCSISAPRNPLGGIVEQLAGAMKLELEGLERISPTALVTVELRERSAAQTLEWLLGSANLRASWRTGMLAIRELVPLSPTPEELRELALSTYSGALRSRSFAWLSLSRSFRAVFAIARRCQMRAACAVDGSIPRRIRAEIAQPDGILRPECIEIALELP
jgi:hypothetical protein